MRLRRRQLLGASLAPLARPGAALAADPLAVGALFPSSGPLALLGDETFRGLELATDDRNARGGLFGRPVRLVRGDAATPDQAAAETRRLIEAEHAMLIFGTVGSALALAATQVSELSGASFFELAAIADAVTGRGLPHVFRSCPMARALAAAAVAVVPDVLVPLWGARPGGLPRVVIVHEDGPAGASVAEFQRRHCGERGLAVAELVSYPADALDLVSVAERLRGVDAPVALHTGVSGDIVALHRAWRTVGWRPRMVVGTGAGYSLTDTAQTLGADFEGVLVVDFPGYRMAGAIGAAAELVAGLYQRKYGAPPRSGHSLAGWVGGRFFHDAVAAAGSTDREKVRAAVLALDVPEGTTPGGWGARFDETGQNGRGRPVLLQWQGGVEVVVGPAEVAVAGVRGDLG